MAHYLIGDIQGCDSAFVHLLDKISFSKSRDTIYPLGDLVNRGPDSLATIKRLMSFGSSAQCILGNHDLHLLAASCKIRPPNKRDTISDILKAPERSDIIQWVRQQPLTRLITHEQRSILLVHAGILPQWSAQEALMLGQEVSQVLQSTDWMHLIAHLYGDTPNQWHHDLVGLDRWRLIVNACTRLRFCSQDGIMEFDSKESAHGAPNGFQAWFDVKSRQSFGEAIAFGHWSTLDAKTHRRLEKQSIFALDTGCVWGGCLTALRLEPELPHTRIQVKCQEAQKPG